MDITRLRFRWVMRLALEDQFRIVILFRSHLIHKKHQSFELDNPKWNNMSRIEWYIVCIYTVRIIWSRSLVVYVCFCIDFLHDYGNNNLLWHIVTLIQNDLQLIFMLHLIKSYILYKKYRQSRRLKNTGSWQKSDVLK